LVEKRYHEEDLKHVSNEWNESLSAALEKMPEEWMEEIITESDKCLPKFIH
jgi:hypothetical protein